MADFRLTQTGQQVQSILNQAAIDNGVLTLHVDNTDIHVTAENKAAWNSKYNKPSGGIPDTDLTAAIQQALLKAISAYQKPQGGIPSTDLTAAAQALLQAAGTAYQKPGAGIPKTDLATAVQNLLDAAGTAYQKPNDGIPLTDLAASVQAAINAAAGQQEAITALQGALTNHVGNSDIHVTTQDKVAWNAKTTSADVSAAIAAALADYDTSAEVTAAIAAALTTYSTTSEVSAAIASALTNYYTKTVIDTMLAGKQATLQFDQTPTLNSANPVTSEGIRAAIASAVSGLVNSTYVQNAISTALADYSTTSQVSTMISTALNSALQAYATKEYVSNQVQEYAGTFRGTFASLADLQATTGNHHNDYAWVQVTDSDGDNDYDRYKYNGTAWVFEYRLNNTHFTSAQLAAISSGITSEKVASYDSHLANTTVHITSAERQTWNAKQNAITDGAQIGLGYGVCSTDATTVAKTATIDNFLLLKNMPVSIRFTKAINVDEATLNISSTGAKPLFIDGAALQGGIVKAGCTITVIYDGTNWNIICIEGLERPSSQSDLFVDMGLPSGLLWAIANIDMTTQSGFAEVDGKPSPFKYEGTFFSWGNTEGHNPISDSAFSYDWGTGNDGPYAQTPGAALTANAGLSYDAARAILGAPWRDPSTEDLAELFANIDYVQADGQTVIDASQANKLATVNSITGIYLKSKINGKLLFFPCSGYGHGQSWGSRGSRGYYWSRSLYSQTNGRYLLFYSGGVLPQDSGSRFNGFARRAVQ